MNQLPTTLYRYFDGEGGLLYVGVSKHPIDRLGQHRADKPWWSGICTITMEHYPTRQEALDAESQAIAIERPAHNKAGARRGDLIDPSTNAYGYGLYGVGDALWMAGIRSDATLSEALVAIERDGVPMQGLRDGIHDSPSAERWRTHDEAHAIGDAVGGGQGGNAFWFR